MIRLLKDCFDRKGNRYKVISFNGDRYQCQSYSNGKSYYFYLNEITSSMPRHSERVKFTEIIKKKEEVKNEEVEEIAKPVENTILEPEYEEPVYEVPEYDYGIDEKEKAIVPKDNIKETAEDFYADL